MANFDKKDSAKRRVVQKLEIQRKFLELKLDEDDDLA